MGTQLILFNHKTRKSYDLGKINKSGNFDYKLSNFVMHEGITEEIFSDYRDQVLVENTGQSVELVRSDTERHGDLLSMKFRHYRVDDFVFHGDGIVY